MLKHISVRTTLLKLFKRLKQHHRLIERVELSVIQTDKL